MMVVSSGERIEFSRFSDRSNMGYERMKGIKDLGAEKTGNMTFVLSDLIFDHVWLELSIKQLREMLYGLWMYDSGFERDIISGYINLGVIS